MKNFKIKYLFMGIFALICTLNVGTVFAIGPNKISVTLPTSVTSSSATLHGSYDSTGLIGSTDVYFEYDNNSTFSSPATTTPNTMLNPVGTFSDAIGGLNPSTTYYFRAVGTIAGGSKRSTAMSFTTLPGVVTPACKITSFTSNNISVLSGTPVTFSWSTSNCNDVTLDGVNYAPLTSATITVNSNKTFTLLAKSTITSTADTKSIPINVTTPACRITSFTATPSSVPPATPVSIAWSTTNCNSITINGVSGLTSPYVSVPGGPGTYTLVAVNTIDGTTDTQTISVSVIVPPPPASCKITYFNGSSSNISAFSPVTLTWTTSNCTTVTLNGAPSSSPITLYPSASIMYTLFASDTNTLTSDTKTFYVAVVNGGGTTSGGSTTSGTTTTGGTTGSSWRNWNSGWNVDGRWGNSTSGGSGRLPNNNTGSPLVSTNGNPLINGTTVVISGSANANGDSNIKAWFEYGPTQNLSAKTITQTFGTSGSPSAQIYNLTPYTKYYFRAVAQNSFGISYGVVYTFISGGPLTSTNINQNPVTNPISESNTINNKNQENIVNKDNTDITENDYQNSLSANATNSGAKGSQFNFLWLLLFVAIVLIIIIIARSIKNKSAGEHNMH